MNDQQNPANDPQSKVWREQMELLMGTSAHREAVLPDGDVFETYVARNRSISDVPQWDFPREAPQGRLGMMYQPSKLDVIAMDIAARQARGENIIFVDTEAGFSPQPQFSSAALRLAMQNRTKD